MASEPHSVIIEKAKQSLNGHELHILESGEKQLYELAASGLTNIKCSKNPGHVNFIPRTSFKLEHLPPEYRDQLVFDWVDTAAELTGLLTISHISEGRPEMWPGTQDPYPCGNVRGNDVCQTGTGRVWRMDKKFYTSTDGVPCSCGVCAVSDAPSTTWGKFGVITATHVVVDDVEAKASDLKLFYKSGKPTNSKVKVAYGLKMEASEARRDWCEVWYVTHEKTVYDTLRETCGRWKDLWQKVFKKYSRKNKDRVGDLAVIVSHPHSCHQHVTVGKITNREEDDEAPDYYSRYTYSTDTCSGSSGSALLMPGWWHTVFWQCPHPHSRACPPGQHGNQSAVCYF